MSSDQLWLPVDYDHDSTVFIVILSETTSLRRNVSVTRVKHPQEDVYKALLQPVGPFPTYIPHPTTKAGLSLHIYFSIMSDTDSPRRPSQVRFSDDQEQSTPAAYPQAPSSAYLPPHVPFYGGPGYPVMPVPAPYWPGGNSLGVWLPADYPRRGSAESDATLNNDAHDGAPRPQSWMRRTNTDGLDSLEQGAMNRAAQRGQDLWSKLFNFRGGFNPAADGDDDSDDEGAAPISRANSESQSIFMKRSDSKMSVNSLSSVHNDHEGPLDADDPHVTGKRKEHLEDIEDVAHHMHQHMQHDYKARRREREKIKIEYHITCEYTIVIDLPSFR